MTSRRDFLAVMSFQKVFKVFVCFLCAAFAIALWRTLTQTDKNSLQTKAQTDKNSLQTKARRSARFWPLSTKESTKLNIFPNDAGRKLDFPAGNITPVKGRPIKVFTHGKEDLISNLILTPGLNHEDHIIQAMLKFMETDPSIHLIDIGTYLGIYSLSAAALGRRAVAVDANRNNLVRLAKSVVANGFQKNIVLVNNALDCHYSTLFLRIQAKHIGASFIITDKNKNKYKNMKTIAVKSVVADDLLDVIDFTRAVIKMDIEGKEGPVLRRAFKLFEKVDVPLILMEWNKMKQNHPDEAPFIRTFLNNRGLTAYAKIESLQPLPEDSTTWPFDIVWKRRARLY